ncbi:hypothetical protein GCM10018962_01460 [Dactylosporangium matsuzakiense]|uniref:Transglycosylase SLT domain-containing protein n=1 Tax=Dactylosporangium matsuzakiense TaxID=53360 RepID=A0A9W6NKD4_9ACTN|nr:hypothetical protein GCM10017581_017080 [Dactylosporangium matsuzakiense]
MGNTPSGLVSALHGRNRAPFPVPDEWMTPVIRLWHRVGTIRAVFALVILAGLVGGIAIAVLQTQHDPSSPDTVKAADAAAFPVSSSSATPSVTRSPNSLAEADALAKAQAAAEEASSQAKAADDEARKKAEEEASRSKTRSPSPSTTTPTNSAPKYPVPASCDVYSGNKKIGCAVLLGTGFGLDQMPCLANMWDKESGWNPKAANPSGAYGIPQANPGSKMSSAGADWKTNPETQIRWGLGYIKGKYQSPCGAWSYWQSHHYY